ncbi:hypothetical protein H0V99_03835 [Candidatus Saccharibacteria bacterium]|nr:hypothetical protein [Candidatus Saccharibacteria bacterium]
MKKAVIIIAGLIIIGAVTVFALRPDDNDDASITPTINTETAEQSADGQELGSEAETSTETSTEMAALTIIYTDSGFEEDTYSVTAGKTITIKNDSSRSLDFASDEHPIHTGNSELNVGVVRAGQTMTFSVEKTGEWGFHNHLLSSHEGILTVQ